VQCSCYAAAPGMLCRTAPRRAPSLGPPTLRATLLGARVLDAHHQLDLVHAHVARGLERAQHLEDLAAVGLGGLCGQSSDGPMQASVSCVGWARRATWCTVQFGWILLRHQLHMLLCCKRSHLIVHLVSTNDLLGVPGARKGSCKDEAVHTSSVGSMALGIWNTPWSPETACAPMTLSTPCAHAPPPLSSSA
jgi:hypothetical protein